MSEHEEDFAALFEASAAAKRFTRGQLVDGKIIAIGSEVALVDIGAKGEAELAVSELKDDEGRLDVAVGERIQARVVSTTGGLKLSRKGVRSATTQRELEEAFQSGLAVEGKVVQVLKGGYEVRVARERGFCPISQIDIARTIDPAIHVGKVYAFKIIEFRQEGKDIVVSRRALLEDEQRAAADTIRKAIVPGAILPGRVVSVREFGAFVDLGGGIQGLLHVSEMSWSRAANPAEIVAQGDEITVSVLRVDEATQKISLGLKQLSTDPWTTVATSYAVGQVHTGRVTRVADFGAFVELAPGIEALAHVSTFPPTGTAKGWMAAVPPGITGSFEILSIDVANRRLGVALVDSGSARALDTSVAVAPPSDAIAPGARVLGKIERHEPFGVFVYLSPGKIGLMPHAETGLDRGADLKKAFPVGSEIEVVVLEVDGATRRIRVSKKAVAEQAEAAELREYSARRDKPPESLGSLADKLRGALGKR